MFRKIQRNNFTHLDALADFLQLSQEQKAMLLQRPAFVLNLPLRLAEKIEKGCLDDPILRQFVPLQEEKTSLALFKEDPVEDRRFALTPRLLKKYRGRALLITTGACAMHCRYCFRQNYPYQEGNIQKDLAAELELIANDKSLEEVILSGGDPLSLSNERLGALLKALAQFPHIKRLRFHTRFMIGIPERIDEGLLQLLADCPQQIWWVLHCNHPKELDSEVIAAIKKLQGLGIPILNQSVLLRGVNDTLSTLKALSQALVNIGVQPYYLHQLDRVQGAAHFEVPIFEAKKLIEQLRQELSGYGVPLYVQELAGEASKTPL